MTIKQKKGEGPPDFVIYFMLVLLVVAIGFIAYQTLGPSPEYKEDYSPTTAVDSVSVESANMDAAMNE